ncbi:hypothetical protein GW17_00047832 [Ensete ventricosum]|nr:hypothetical protein GW17_00047832 [Ensete ventricosum]
MRSRFGALHGVPPITSVPRSLPVRHVMVVCNTSSDFTPLHLPTLSIHFNFSDKPIHALRTCENTVFQPQTRATTRDADITSHCLKRGGKPQLEKGSTCKDGDVEQRKVLHVPCFSNKGLLTTAAQQRLEIEH